MIKQLHIVCLDVPWPADYGGAIDMMNRIRMFHQLGVGVHLHYFSYNERGTPAELNQWCASVQVYQRKTGTTGFSLSTPYIVASRNNEKLVADLLSDQHPVLIEGVHCAGILPRLNTAGRKIVVRMHNDESTYYRELARSERSLFRKLYFYHESRLLRKFSSHLPDNCYYACVSEKDIEVFRQDYGLGHSEFIPTFPAWQKVTSKEGVGTLCLYHGNLSVPENEQAALWLLCRVFNRIRVPFVIAGKKPSRRLQKMAHLCQHTCIVADPSESELDDLIGKAHINVLPSFNKNITGIRLKLLHALYQGRHCVVNEPMVAGTGLEAACHVGHGANAIASIIAQLYHQPFAEEEIRLRENLLYPVYNNEANTRKLIQWLW